MAFQPRGCTQRVSHQQWAHTSCSTAGLRAHQIVRPNVSQSQAENTRKKWKSACSGVRSCAWYLRPPPHRCDTAYTIQNSGCSAPVEDIQDHRLQRVRPQSDGQPSNHSGLTPATSAPGLGPPRPHLHRDWAHPCHICIRTGLTPATSAPGLGPPLPHLHRDWAHPTHICSGTGPPQLISHRIRFSDVAMNNRPMAEASGSAARHPCRAAQPIVVDGLRRAAVSSRAEHNRE